MSCLIWIYSVCPLVLDFQIIQFILKVFRNFADLILSFAFLAIYGLNEYLQCEFLWRKQPNYPFIDTKYTDTYERQGLFHF